MSSITDIYDLEGIADRLLDTKRNKLGVLVILERLCEAVEDQGFTKGYEEGSADGYDEGWSSGYSAGLEEEVL